MRTPKPTNTHNHINPFNMKKFETWLPVFPGFYGTIFECSSEEQELENINEIRSTPDPFGQRVFGKVKFDHCEWDYETYNQEVVQKCTKVVQGMLYDVKLIEYMKYQSISSPKEYNFRNDSGNVEVGMTEDQLDALDLFLQKHWKSFEKYIHDKHTSRSGFISFHSNDATEWREETEMFHVFPDTYKLGAVLDFCVRVLVKEDGEYEGCYEEWLYYAIVDYPSISVDNYDEVTTKHLCSECNEFFDSYDFEYTMGKCHDCLGVDGDAVEARHLMNRGFEFESGYEKCYALNRALGEHRVTQFKGFWVKGSEMYGVSTSTPQIDVYGVKIG
jgi:hypothetical protein